MTSWHSYPKIYNLGHNAIKELFFDPVVIEEKVDGSQFSFGKFDGKLKIRSKGQEMHPEAPEKMFQLAVDSVMSRFDLLTEGWTYRGEYLCKPKHNALAYDRIPNGNIIIFDINTAEETYLSYSDKIHEAKLLGYETVPNILTGGVVPDPESLIRLLDTVSILGGQKIEGFVIKNYSRFGPDNKVLMGKHVSEAFKEVHKSNWKIDNPKQNDIVMILQNTYRSPARWNKAIQHLREKGLIEDSPKDIGPILKELGNDVKAECEDEIKETLFKWAWPSINRGINKGFPEWYKDELLKRQFG